MKLKIFHPMSVEILRRVYETAIISKDDGCSYWCTVPTKDLKDIAVLVEEEVSLFGISITCEPQDLVTEETVHVVFFCRWDNESPILRSLQGKI